MRYITLICLALFFAACHKNEEPCPMVYNDFAVSDFKVIAFIDKDSNNLLLNHTVDTADIVIKNDKGQVQQFTPWLDSTLTKARYISLPLGEAEGITNLTVNVNGVTNRISYRYTVTKSKCNTNYVYDAFTLNGNRYDFKSQPDYMAFMYNDVKQKHLLYTSPMYIVIE